MEWTADVSVGDWLHERVSDGDPWGTTMHNVVPRGFPAYARVFHQATRSRPVGRAWPPLPYDDNVRAWEAFGRAGVEVDTEAIRWADVATAFGTTMHPLAQWNALVRVGATGPNDWQQVQGPDGWQYDAPMEGQVDAASLAAIAGHLAAATSTPDAGYVALWEGHGALLGHVGHAPSRTFFAIGSADGAPLETAVSPHDGGVLSAEAAVHERHHEMLQRSVHDPFNNVFRRPTWQPGILSREISEGPRLELPARGHVLFRGGIVELADPDWFLTVPWRDRPAEEHGFDPSAISPSLIWPDDRAWMLVTEVDYDSTVIGGSPELVGALCADQSLEALPLPEGADLTYAGDRINA